MASPIEIQRHLKGVDYPADQDDLVAAAERNDAPEEVLETLQDLPEQLYEGPDEVMEALGGDDD